MTIEEKRKALEDFCGFRTCEGCVLHSQNCGFEALDDAEVETSYDMAFRPEVEVERLKAEVDNLTLTLCGVMHFVDKWLDGEELDKDEVTRADTMREKTLTIVEVLQEQLKTARADAVREFADKLRLAFRTKQNCFGLEGLNDKDIMMIMREMMEDEHDV